jgi:hypothetical protein
VFGERSDAFSISLRARQKEKSRRGRKGEVSFC